MQHTYLLPHTTPYTQSYTILYLFQPYPYLFQPLFWLFFATFAHINFKHDFYMPLEY